MAQLSTVISSILRDMVIAQHQANLYAMTLKDMYGKNGRLDSFPLPAVALGEMEISIQYSITDAAAEVEQLETNFPALRDFVRSVSWSSAGLLLDSAVPVLMEAMPVMSSRDASPPLALGDEAKMRDFRSFLSRKTQKSLQKDITAIVSEDGSINQKSLAKIILAVGEEWLLNQKDIREMLDKNDGEGYDDRVRNFMRDAVSHGLPALLQGVNVKRKRMVPSVDVCVSSEELSKLPEDSIHALHFKVTPDKINMYLKDE